MERCEPPVHRFAGNERTCRCGEVSVPDPTARFMQSMKFGNMRPKRRGVSSLARLRVPVGPGKPPAR